MDSSSSQIVSESLARASISETAILADPTKPRHRWYSLKEAFSPEVVDIALKDARLKETQAVIDPFSGSGTVPIQSALSGYAVRAYEVNPFLAFVASAKAAHCDPKSFSACASDVARSMRRGGNSGLRGFSTFTGDPDLRTAEIDEKWLFNLAVIDAFDAGWRAAKLRRGAVRKLIQLCLLSASTEVCNARKDGKALRYHTDWLERAYSRQDLIDTFEEKASEVELDLASHPIDSRLVDIVNGDSRRAEMKNGFKLCVTSPPYLNSFDYTDIYRPELFLGGWVTSMQQLRALRRRTMRSHVQVKWKHPTESDFGPMYLHAISEINKVQSRLWSARIPLMIQAYFEDMKRVMTSLRDACAPNASLWLVVSTSAYGGVEIPVDLILADVGNSVGWSLREVVTVRQLKRVGRQQMAKFRDGHGPTLRESVVILEARKGSRWRITS
jgi:hypothetical protein